MGFLAFTTFDLVNNLVGILYIIFNVFLYAVVVFLVKGKIKWMNEWMDHSFLKIQHEKFYLQQLVSFATNIPLEKPKTNFAISV